MELRRLQQRFENRINLAETQFSLFLSSSSGTALKKQEIHQLEGWLSDVWQTWCRFCRITVFKSCTGCTSASVGLIPASHTNIHTISFIAAKQKRGVPPAIVGSNKILRHEPTWGHIDKLLDVIKALSPSNSSILLSGFGTLPQIDEIRIIRNAAAHWNNETHTEVLALSSAYTAHQINHPIEALLWNDPYSGRTLVQARMEDMRIASRNACS